VGAAAAELDHRPSPALAVFRAASRQATWPDNLAKCAETQQSSFTEPFRPMMGCGVDWEASTSLSKVEVDRKRASGVAIAADAGLHVCMLRVIRIGHGLNGLS
jgi:hypothetical protein